MVCLSGPVGAAVAKSLGLPPNPPPNQMTYSLPANECAAVLNGALTLNPASTPLQAFLLNELETNGGLFNYKTRVYLASGRFDHRFSDSDQVTATYRFGHDLEENPDVQSLTGFSAGSSIHDYDNNALAAWYHQFEVPRRRTKLSFNSTTLASTSFRTNLVKSDSKSPAL